MSTKNVYHSGLDTSSAEAEKETHADQAAASSATVLKSSLKTAGVKKLNHSVTWADNKKAGNGHNGSLCEVKEWLLKNLPASVTSESPDATASAALLNAIAQASADTNRNVLSSSPPSA
ncbi:hypothetical protein CRYUN_Cryun25bG0123000 [Craigia yunnanensis]